MAEPPKPPFRGRDWSDDLERAPGATELIFKGHLRLERWLRQRAQFTLLSVSLFEGFHRTIFWAVWPDFAGRLRGPSPTYIHRNVTFGRYRGTHADGVVAECEQLAQRLVVLTKQLDELRAGSSPDGFRDEVLKVAAYGHCELIRIHPFVNGNGRTAREIANYFAWRYGISPFSFARPQGEYLAAIRGWLDYKNIDGMVDVLRDPS